MSMLEERQAMIDKGVQAAKDAAVELENSKAKAEKYMAEAKKNAAQVLQNANKKATLILEEARKKAEVEREISIRGAKQEIDSFVAKAKEDFKDEMSELICENTKSILSDYLDNDSQEKILNKAIQELH